MKKVLLIFVIVSLPSALFVLAANRRDAPPGGIRLLPGYQHKIEQGIDTQVGKILKDGGLTLEYDIGRLAGYYADAQRMSEYLWYKEQVVGGQNVRCALTKDNQLIVTFPDSSANFFGKVKSQEDMADALLMTLTYQGGKSP